MKLKKILAAVVSVAMLGTMSLMTGCNDTTGPGTDDSDNASTDKIYNIGVCQFMEHEALGAATQGFSDKLTELLGADHVNIKVQTAQGETTNCVTIVNSFISSDVDLILANATPPLSTAVNATDAIPIIGTSITDYASALGVSDWNGKSGRNVTGTSDLAPIDQQEKLLLELYPNPELVGILYCSSEPNSKYQAELFEAALEADGVAYKEFTAADSNDISSVTQAAVDQCDILYIPTDNTFADHTETIKNIVLPAKTPVIAGEEGICGVCGVATLSISYYDIGTISAEMAYEILVNGADPGEMEIRNAPKFTKKYNAEMCEALNITPPEGYEAIA